MRNKFLLSLALVGSCIFQSCGDTAIVPYEALVNSAEVEPQNGGAKIRFMYPISSFGILDARVEIERNKGESSVYVTLLSRSSGKWSPLIHGNKAGVMLTVRGNFSRDQVKFFYRDTRSVHEIPLGNLETWRVFIHSIYMKSSVSVEEVDSWVNQLK